MASEDIKGQKGLAKDALNSQSKHGMQEVLWSLLYGMGESRVRAAKEIQRLTKTSAKCRAYLGATGVIVPLVSMVKSSSMEAREAAVLALLSLATQNERNKVSIVKAGAITPLVEMLASDHANMREFAAAVLLTLSVSNANKPVIGASRSIPLLVEMLSTGTLQGKVDAVLALHNLSTFPGNMGSILVAGAVLPLLLLLKDCRKACKVAEKTMGLLELLMGSEEGRCCVLTEEGGLLAMVEVLEEGSGQGREHAVGALLTMCESNRCKYRDAMLREGLIPGLLELTVQGTKQAQLKAHKLLELLRDTPRSPRNVSHSVSLSMLESIVYEIASHVDNGEPAASGAAKKMLAEMVQLSIEKDSTPLEQAVGVTKVSFG